MLADKLNAAGVKVDYRNYEGVTHEFSFQSLARGAQPAAAGASRK